MNFRSSMKGQSKSVWRIHERPSAKKCIQTPILSKIERIQKLEIGKAWKFTSSCCVICMLPTSYKNKNTMNLYVRISSKKLGFLTHLFQETKLESVISSKVPSFHTRNIFSLILAAGSKGHNLDPLNLFWELLMCITKQIALIMGI